MLLQGEMLNNLTAEGVVKKSHSKNWMPSFLTMKNCITSLSSDKLIKPLWEPVAVLDTNTDRRRYRWMP